MATTSGVGYSNNSSSREAGAEAAKKALDQMGSSKTDLCLIFTTSKHDPIAIREGIRSVVGAEAKMIGGYAVGIITKDHLSYGGYEVGVATISSDSAKFDVLAEKGLGQ